MIHHPRVAAVALCLCLATACSSQAQEGKVYNGAFDKLAADGRTPDGWQTEGEKAIVQEVTVDKDTERGDVARLTCTKFVPGTSSSHAMLSQRGYVGMKSGQWYKLSLWLRCADLETGVVGMNIANFRTWGRVGTETSWSPTDEWQRYEHSFRANGDLAPADSRLAIYFTSTGTLWVDDVALEESTEPKREWLPALPLEGVTNALPNSSFECGGEGWATWWPGWVEGSENLFRRAGEWDRSQAFEGKSSWKLTLSSEQPLMIYAGGRNTVTLESLELGHLGWVRVQPGQPYVFSAYARAAKAGTQVGLYIREPGDWRLSNSRSIMANDKWQRGEVTYTPKGEFVAASVGIRGPKKGETGETTVWVDALQFERGAAATPYQPRAAVEAAVETDATGNIFTDPAQGLRFRLNAYNASQEARPLKGRLSVTDFWGRTVWEEEPALTLAPQQPAEKPYALLAGRQGFFRVRWEPEGGLAQSIRCSVIEPYQEDDSLFGFNHAFSQDFVLGLSHAAGLRWWRDWSNYWDTVQPKEGAPFDFSVPDGHVSRLQGLNGRVLMLLPAPSAAWAAGGDPKIIQDLKDRRQKGQLLESQLWISLVAQKPARMEDFAEYVRQTVMHYRGKITDYEILNESVYTFYSLPNRGFNYGTADYIEMLKTAYQAAKAADPKCRVMGGIACWPGMKWEDEFIEQGGLQWCDVSNYHMYLPPSRAEGIESVFKMRWEQMKKRGQAKPIWVTEYGLYAEDDVPFTPFHLGRPDDETMNRAMRADEFSAAADLVQFTAMMCANGVRKVFYHAGCCQSPRGISTYNVFFEYGGAPRKMYAAQAVLSRLLGPDLEFVRKWDKPEGVHAYEYRSRGKTVVILWTRKSNAPKLDMPQGFRALDLMGNDIDKSNVVPSRVPVYLVGG